MTLAASSCLGLHLTLKTTFACVDKAVFQEQYVDRPTTTTTTTTTSTTTTTAKTSTTSTAAPTQRSAAGWEELSTRFWSPLEDLGVQAKPLEPKPKAKPISEEELAQASGQGGAFAKVNNYKHMLTRVQSEVILIYYKILTL